MKTLKQWGLLAAKGLLALIVLALLLGGAWWLTRSPVPEGVPQLQEQRGATVAYEPAADSALALIEHVSKAEKLPSVSVAVSIRDTVVWAVALGMADVGEGHPAQLATRYRAGSISKTMTGLLAAILVEDGQLDLDASVRSYVPSFPEKRWTVTSRQLGAHTGGIRHYADPGASGFWTEQFSSHHYESVEEALDLFKDDSLLFEPGTDFAYSTHGFTLLSAVLEKAGGASYGTLISDRLWTPFGMENTRLDDITHPDSNRAVPYVSMGGRLVHMEGPDPSYKWAGAGILTTPQDLVRMGGAFLSNRIVDADLRADLFQPQPLKDGSPNPEGYALGLRNERVTERLTAQDTLSVLHHGGNAPGGSSFLLLVPDDTLAVAAMTNVTLNDPSAFRHAVYDVAALFRTNQRTARSENLTAEKD